MLLSVSIYVLFARVEFASLLEKMRNLGDVLHKFSPRIQSSILRSLTTKVTSERLHGICVVHEVNFTFQCAYSVF